MFNIYYYTTVSGKTPILEYIKSLESKNDKNNRIKYNKIIGYLFLLKERGLSVGEPEIKYIGNGLWELRPLRDRIFFVSWEEDGFLLLHHFQKSTQKTPKREIDKALKNLKEIQERKV